MTRVNLGMGRAVAVWRRRPVHSMPSKGREDGHLIPGYCQSIVACRLVTPWRGPGSRLLLSTSIPLADLLGFCSIEMMMPSLCLMSLTLTLALTHRPTSCMRVARAGRMRSKSAGSRERPQLARMRPPFGLQTAGRSPAKRVETQHGRLLIDGIGISIAAMAICCCSWAKTEPASNFRFPFWGSNADGRSWNGRVSGEPLLRLSSGVHCASRASRSAPCRQSSHGGR